MQFLMAVVAAITGMTFSLGFAIFVEELVFGKVLRMMFRQSQAIQNTTQQPAAKPIH
jgi:hypothetical protein